MEEANNFPKHIERWHTSKWNTTNIESYYTAELVSTSTSITSIASIASIVISFVMTTMTAVSVVMISFVIILDINMSSSVLDLIHVVSHLTSVFSTSVLTTVTKTPIHFHTNDLIVNNKTGYIIHSKLGCFVSIESTTETNRILVLNKTKATGCFVQAINSHNHTLNRTTPAKQIKYTIFGCSKCQITDIYRCWCGKRLLLRFECWEEFSVVFRVRSFGNTV